MITSLFKDEKELERLPKSLQKAVKNTATLELLKNISADMSLSQEQENNFTDIVFSIIKGEVELYDCVALISGVLEIDFDRALEINDKLYDNLFFGIESDINDQFVLYQKTKAPIKEAVIEDEDIKKSQKEKSDFLPLIEKAVKKFNLFFAPHPASILPSKEREDVGLKKFSEMAETFLSNVRTKSQFKNTLIKPVADGGLGMEHQLADDVAEFLASYLRIREIEKKKEKSSGVIPSGARAESRDLTPSKKQTGEISPLVPKTGLGRNDKKESMSPRPVPPNVKIEVSFEKEEKEAAAKKPKIEKMRIVAPKLLSPSFVALAKNDVTEGVQSALAELNYTFPSSEMQDRLKSIIDARVRNVRTSVQTFDKLTQDIPSGGLGFAKLEADNVSLVLNKYLEDKNKDIYGSKLAEIKQAEDEEKNKNEERARAAEDAEKKNFDDRFTKLTGKTPPPMSAAAPAEKIPPLTPPLITPLRQGSAGQARGEKESKQIPLPPEEAPYSVIPSGAQAEPRDLTLSKKQTSEISPRASLGRNDTKPGLPKSSIINQKSEIPPPPRPVLEDIKFTPKLAGPTEEIARLTLDDFRKLSHDPKEAVMKIKDKLALLRGESYKKYLAGVDGWRNSSLYGEYLKIINKSLSEGTPLDAAITSAKTLTKDEFDAIINSKIGD